ncbi:hypothetical protein B0J14DRAFT_133113 [Halenospora varia]|nr:hypothetical protein B0J14DRAFT_133113 [Halenospora varia]
MKTYTPRPQSLLRVQAMASTMRNEKYISVTQCCVPPQNCTVIAIGIVILVVAALVASLCTGDWEASGLLIQVIIGVGAFYQGWLWYQSECSSPNPIPEKTKDEPGYGLVTEREADIMEMGFLIQ